MKPGSLIILSAVAVIALAAGLFSGGDWLGIETPVFGIPFGNFAAWALLIAWCVLAWASTPGRRSRTAPAHTSTPSRHSRPPSRHSRESGNLETTDSAVLLHRIALALLALAAAWLPISIALFGNVHLNNAGPVAYNVWLAYTGTLLLAPVLVMSVLAIGRLADRSRAG